MGLTGVGAAAELTGLIFMSPDLANRQLDSGNSGLGLGLIVGAVVSLVWAMAMESQSETDLYQSIDSYNQEKIRRLAP